MEHKRVPCGTWGRLFLTSLSSSLLAFLFCTQRFAGSSKVRWPGGKYGLPMVAPSLCPSSTNISWATGSRYQDTYGKNKRSTNFHLATSVSDNGVEQRFCIKDADTDYDSRPSWPEGRYCVYKKGASCPYGLTEGWVFWDDNNVANKNTKEGTLPNGIYNEDTKIYFCCQTVGNVFHTIYLPVNKPFYLIAFKSFFASNPACQNVHGAMATVEYVRFGVKNNSTLNIGGVFPYGAEMEPEPYIYYCYYSVCKYNMSQLSGSFTSPMFPGEYNNNIDCTWQINRKTNYTIELSFPVFELELSEYCNGPTCPCDYIDILESSLENEDTIFIGRYCNASVLPKVVKSTAEHLIVHFHSDTNVGGKGFKATYKMKSHEQEKISTTLRPSVKPSTGKSDRSNQTVTTSPETPQSIPIETAYAIAGYFVIALVIVGLTLCRSHKSLHSGRTSSSMRTLTVQEASKEKASDVERGETNHAETRPECKYNNNEHTVDSCL